MLQAQEVAGDVPAAMLERCGGLIGVDWHGCLFVPRKQPELGATLVIGQVCWSERAKVVAFYAHDKRGDSYKLIERFGVPDGI